MHSRNYIGHLRKQCRHSRATDRSPPVKVTVERKIIVGLGLALILLCGVGGIALYTFSGTERNAARAQHTQGVLTHLTALLATMTDAETGQRGFVITGNESYLQPYQAALARADEQCQQLRTLMADNPSQQHWLATLRPLIAERLNQLEQSIALRRTTGFEAAQRDVASGRGKTLQDAIRAAIANMKQEEETLLVQREAASQAAIGRTRAAILLGSLAAFGVCGVALFQIFRDLAARRQAEAQLLVAYTDLTAAKERAEAADRLKSAFLATMSHELRTPLNSIIGFTGIILQGLAGPLNAEQTKQLGMVQGSARHLLALINDVLDLSKIEAGELNVVAEPFDLRASIEKTVASVRPLAEKKGLLLRLELAPAVGIVESDARRVEQVLLNLLSNAIKFTEQGEVALLADVTGTTVQLRMVDTGMGIKPEDMDTLFKPFRQIDTGLARNHEGTGLGLTICRRLADLLGGGVCAESEWKKGSVFTFTLPLKGTGHP